MRSSSSASSIIRYSASERSATSSMADRTVRAFPRWRKDTISIGVPSRWAARVYRDRVIAGSVVGDEYLTEGRGIRCPVASDGRDRLLDPAGLVERRHDHGD